MRLLSRLSASVVGDLPVARRGNETVSEKAFRSRAAAWALALGAIEAPAVALSLTDSVEFAAALLGGWHAGKTVYLPGDTLPATCRQLAKAGVRFAGEFPPELAPVAPGADGDPQFPFNTLAADFTGVVIYTSGSTGEPQALPKRLSQLASEVEMLELQFGAMLTGASVVSTVSHQHIYGLLFRVLWPLVAGRPFLAESVAYPEQIVMWLSGRRTVLVSSPAHLKRLPNSLDWSAAPASTAAVFSSGGPLPAAAAAHVEQLMGSAPFEVYGSSETGGIAWRQRPGGEERPWRPLPGVSVRLDDGALAVRSPQLPSDEWFSTADQASLEEDGTFTLAGRADRIAKIEGKRVSLTAVERALAASPLVSEVRVVPLTDERDLLAAVVVPSDDGWRALRGEGAAAVGRRLRESIADSTDRVALPRRWRWVEALPVNSQGKVTVAELERAFAGDVAAMPAFRVVERTTENAVIEMNPPPTLGCFDGHFAGAPVLAGVVQIDWAIELAQELFGFTGGFQRMEALKFQRVYQPGNALRIELDWRAEPATLRFRFASEAGSHSSGRIFFAS